MQKASHNNYNYFFPSLFICMLTQLPNDQMQIKH
jgi:hypothetical protein